MDYGLHTVFETAMAPLTSVKSPQEALEKLLTHIKINVRTQIGCPSVHQKVIGFRRERASEGHGLHSGPLPQMLLFWKLSPFSEWLVQDRQSVIARKLVGA